MEILVKNRNFRQKSKFSSKIETFVTDQNFDKNLSSKFLGYDKIQFLTKIDLNFVFYPKYTFLTKFCVFSKFLPLTKFCVFSKFQFSTKISTF